MQQNLRDYYQILGVTKKSSNEDIKRAYRALARKYHPDKNQGNKIAEEKFKDINEAYQVLSDPARRAQYEPFADSNWGKKVKPPRSPRPPRTKNNVGRKSSDFPDDFFYPGRNSGTSTQESPTSKRYNDPSYTPGTNKYTRPASRPVGRDIEAKLTLPLSKAYRGGRERIRLEDGRSLEVDMPSGMFNGQKIRLKGQGLDGGNLYLKISVARHPFFDVRGKDVFCKIPITPVEATLGGGIEVPTIDGLVKMTLPAGVRSGQRLRLADKGYPDKTGVRGDQLVEIQVVTPKHISDREKELYEQLKEIETFKPRHNIIQSL